MFKLDISKIPSRNDVLGKSGIQIPYFRCLQSGIAQNWVTVRLRGAKITTTGGDKITHARHFYTMEGVLNSAKSTFGVVSFRMVLMILFFMFEGKMQ